MERATEQEAYWRNHKLELYALAEKTLQAAKAADEEHLKAELNCGRIQYALLSAGHEVPISPQPVQSQAPKPVVTISQGEFVDSLCRLIMSKVL